MVRTEVATLDDALKLIESRNKRAKGAKTQSIKPTTWQDELKLHGMRKKQNENKSKSMDLVVGQESISAFEARQVEYICQAIAVLKRSVEEMSGLAAVRSYYPAVNRTAVADIITKLCHLIKQDPPAFTPQHLPRPATTKRERWCQKCGTVLPPREKGQFCFICTPVVEDIKAASNQKREQAALDNNIKAVSRLINQVKRAIDHDTSD
jgi:hypothetical protein